MMKRMDLFCPSVASTEICMSTTDHPVVHGGGKAIDRHNPHLRDNRRRNHFITSTATAAASSSSSPQTHSFPPHKRSSKSNKNKSRISSYSCARRCDRGTISPPGSTRYLLSDTAFVDEFPLVQSSESCILEPEPSSSPTPVSTPTTHDHQVVVLRVSLHCRGCEGKVRKHLSKMKGVTSFNIDFATNKVTVIGDVTPLGVLASISRVKKAQFWPSLSSSRLSILVNP